MVPAFLSCWPAETVVDQWLGFPTWNKLLISGSKVRDARFRLPLAEMLDLCHDVLGRQEGLARTDLRLGRGLRTDVWQRTK
jgi:hypothetical protein